MKIPQTCLPQIFSASADMNCTALIIKGQLFRLKLFLWFFLPYVMDSAPCGLSFSANTVRKALATALTQAIPELYCTFGGSQSFPVSGGSHSFSAFSSLKTSLGRWMTSLHHLLVKRTKDNIYCTLWGDYPDQPWDALSNVFWELLYWQETLVSVTFLIKEWPARSTFKIAGHHSDSLISPTVPMQYHFSLYIFNIFLPKISWEL